MKIIAATICLIFISLSLTFAASLVGYTYSGAGPHSWYPDYSFTDLTDGYMPPSSQPYSIDAWVGAGYSGSTMVPVFQFDAPIQINSVQIYVYAGTAGIYQPKKIAVSFSNISATTGFSTPQIFSFAETIGVGKVETGILSAQLTVPEAERTAKYVKVDIYDSPLWIFVAEVGFNNQFGGNYAVVTPEPSSMVFSLMALAMILMFRHGNRKSKSLA